ncbi:MAG: Gfo/Idh/MocA family oxidoreductase, partial [Bacteroidota bacterium]
MNAKIRWGIVGPGKIAQKFCEDLIAHPDAEIVATGSRNLARARQFAEEFNIPNHYDSYDALFSDSAVEVVYIATPHRFHHGLSLKAMESGKHVLCEKPLGVNAKEVRELVKCAEKNQVFLMEGLWTRFNPSIEKIVSDLKQQRIGTVHYVRADFAFNAMDRDLDSRLWNPELASGSLLDIGIYPVFLSYLVLGMPEKIQAMSTFHENGTEIQTAMQFQYPNAMACLYSGFSTTSKMEAEISGSKGQILIQPRWHETASYRIEADGIETLVETPPKGRGFTEEIDEVHACLRRQALQSEKWSLQHSLDLATLLDTVREKVGLRFPF